MTKIFGWTLKVQPLQIDEIIILLKRKNVTNFHCKLQRTFCGTGMPNDEAHCSLEPKYRSYYEIVPSICCHNLMRQKDSASSSDIEPSCVQL